MNAAATDVLVVGAGMVGASLAAALGQAGFAVTLLEAGAVPPAPQGELDTRVTALSLASERMLRRLDIWPAMARTGRVAGYRHMHVWDGAASIDFDAAALPADRLGSIVENQALQRAAVDAATAHETVQLHEHAPLGRIDWTGGAVEVDAAGRRWRARLVVGADGATSRVRGMARIASVGHAYGQRAIVCGIHPGGGHRDTAWQHFLPTGPLAFLPLADGRCAVVWSNDEPAAERLLAASPDDFLNALQAASAGRLGRLTGAGPRAAFPLQYRHAVDYVGPRVALVGDAAHAVHPLAGQGANLGLMDAAALTDVLVAARAAGEDWADRRVLARYARWRRGENLMVSLTLDGFKRLFGTSAPWTRRIRRAGLAATDRLGPLKRRIVNEASGFSGDLPSLAAPDPARLKDVIDFV